MVSAGGCPCQIVKRLEPKNLFNICAWRQRHENEPFISMQKLLHTSPCSFFFVFFLLQSQLRSLVKTMAADASPPFHPGPADGAFLASEVSHNIATHDGLHFYQFMAAGSLAGLAEHTAMFPVDTVKTRLQAACPAASPSLLLRSLLRTEGPAALFRGLPAMALGAAPAHAVYFSVYETSKRLLTGAAASAGLRDSWAHAGAGVAATVASDAVFTPMDLVKQRLQLGGSPYRGLADCAARVAREEGIGAFYASYRTTVVMNAPFTAVHFATYEAAKKALVELDGGQSGDEERLVVHATAGAVAGAAAAAVTTPLDVVKTQLQCQGVCGCDRYSSGSIGEVVGSILKKDGYVGLMRGWMPRMLFHAPAAAICWSTYEAFKSLFVKLNSA